MPAMSNNQLEAMIKRFKNSAPSEQVKNGFVFSITEHEAIFWIRMAEIKLISPLEGNICAISTYKDRYYVVFMSDQDLLKLMKGS